MLNREISNIVRTYQKTFPVLVFTGARQVGKTTLMKALFPKYKYYNLENIEDLTKFQKDYTKYINPKNPRVIVDEIQKFPELLSHIQAVSDEVGMPGNYILSGSENLLLSEKISQSLAGRAGYLNLPPLSISELQRERLDYLSIMLSGLYPAVIAKKLDPQIYYSEYLATYVERDIRNIKEIKNLRLFRQFLVLLAGRTGQLFNASSLSNDLGVSSNTIKDWLSILEASYLIFTLEPFHTNIRKRLIKSPKVYFYDLGLLLTLLGISEKSQLENHPLLGSFFENLIVSETKKQQLNSKSNSNLFFFREKSGREIDLLIQSANHLELVEIKKAATYTTEFEKNLDYFEALPVPSFKVIKKSIVYTGKNDLAGDCNLVNWKNWVNNHEH